MCIWLLYSIYVKSELNTGAVGSSELNSPLTNSSKRTIRECMQAARVTNSCISACKFSTTSPKSFISLINFLVSLAARMTSRARRSQRPDNGFFHMGWVWGVSGGGGGGPKTQSECWPFNENL